MSVAGKWNITIKAPTGAQKTVLELAEQNGEITGAQTGNGTTTAISEASYDGSKLVWTNQVTKPLKMKVVFTATVSGDTMEGKCKAGLMGTYSFTATRA
jgi:hypothetical protein